jgi:hypothetical protein
MDAVASLLEIFKSCNDTTVQFSGKKPNRPSGVDWTCQNDSNTPGFYLFQNRKSTSRAEIISCAAKAFGYELSEEEVAALNAKLPVFTAPLRQTYKPPNERSTSAPKRAPAAGTNGQIRFDLPPLVREPWEPGDRYLFAKVEGRVCSVRGPEIKVRAVRDEIVAVLRAGGIDVPGDIRELRIVVDK